VKLSRRHWIGLGLAGVGVPALAAADAFLVEPGWVKLKRIRLAGDKPACRLLHFTDLHFKEDEASLRSLVRRINGLSPDFVCFTGDLVEDKVHLDAALAVLRELKAPLFGVPGNHERWSGADPGRIAECCEATGGAWLPDRAVDTLEDRVRISGIDEDPGKARPRPGATNIALMHYPAWVERLSGGRFDLVLGGHSHGGQVRLPFVGALIVPFDVGKYDLGLYQTPAGPLYVGAGVGWYSLRARFLCRPEIALIEI